MAERTAYLRFTKEINAQNITGLMNAIQNQIQNGVKHIVILFSSTGGNVHWGMTAYTFLKGLPIQLDIHAFGRVNSVAIPIYCSGETRYVTPNTSFLMHGVGITIKANTRFTLKRLTETMRSLENDTNNITKIISENCEKSHEEIKSIMFEGTIWTTDQALEYGLAHELKEELFPQGVNIITV